jgi:hypothetical protein
MQALHYTRWFTKASISGQKKRTKQQQQTNKQIQRLRTHQNAAGDKRPTREIHGVTEFRVQSRDTVREREIREIKRRIYVREREREVHCARTKAHTEHVQTKDREGNKAA